MLSFHWSAQHHGSIASTTAATSAATASAAMSPFVTRIPMHPSVVSPDAVGLPKTQAMLTRCAHEYDHGVLDTVHQVRRVYDPRAPLPRDYHAQLAMHLEPRYARRAGAGPWGSCIDDQCAIEELVTPAVRAGWCRTHLPLRTLLFAGVHLPAGELPPDFQPGELHRVTAFTPFVSEALRDSSGHGAVAQRTQRRLGLTGLCGIGIAAIICVSLHHQRPNTVVLQDAVSAPLRGMLGDVAHVGGQQVVAPDVGAPAPLLGALPGEAAPPPDPVLDGRVLLLPGRYPCAYLVTLEACTAQAVWREVRDALQFRVMHYPGPMHHEDQEDRDDHIEWM